MNVRVQGRCINLVIASSGSVIFIKAISVINTSSEFVLRLTLCRRVLGLTSKSLVVFKA